MKGWVSFHRQIMKWEWYTDPNTFRLFFHLVLNANHEKANWRGVQILRGQLITSSDKLAIELDLSRQKIRTSLKKLESTKEITIETTNKYTRITVDRYDFYQDDARKATNKLTINQPSNNQQVTTNNNDNNDNNVIIKDIVGYLNTVLNSKYKHNTNKTKTAITARINEGYTEDDFKKVIDIKYAEWNNTTMAKFLRPETLFGTKFESYLNQKSGGVNSGQHQESTSLGEYEGIGIEV